VDAPRSRRNARERLIVTAERLFAQRGIGGVSLREIGIEAGQRNNSASQYHFGSKAGLVEAIFAYRMAAINERRVAALAELDARGMGLDLRGLVEAYIHPLAESFNDTEGERWYVRFLANVLADPGAASTVNQHRDFTEGIDEALDRLDRVLRDLPETVRQERIHAASTLIVTVLASREGAMASTWVSTPTPLVVADLVDMTVGLLSAPVSATTLHELDAAHRMQA